MKKQGASPHDTLNVALVLTGVVTFGPTFVMRFLQYGWGQPPFMDYPGTFETVEKAVVVACLAIGLVLSQIRIQIINRSVSSLTSILASTIVIGAVASRNEYPSIDPDMYWSSTFFGGFGTAGVVYLLIAFLVFEYLQNLRISIRERLGPIIESLSWSILIVLFVPASIFASSGVPFKHDYSLVLSEIIGPLTGNAPLFQAVPQYSSILGWPLVILRGLPAPTLFQLSFLYISLLFVAIIFLFSVILREIHPKIRLGTSLLVASATYLYRPNGSWVGALNNFPSATVRMVLPMTGFVFLVRATKSQFLSRWLTAGLISGLAFINNFEFGSVYLVAVLSLLAVLTFSKQITALALSVMVAGTIAPIAVISLLLGNRISRHYAVALQFADGFGNLLMPRFGLHTLSLGLCVFAVAIGGRILSSRNLSSIPKEPVIALLFGVFSLLGHLYFAGRSVVSTQLQILLPPTALAVVGALSAITASSSFFRSDIMSSHQLKLSRIPLLLITVLPVLLLLGLPNPNLEIARLVNTRSDNNLGDNSYSIKIFEGEFMTALQSSVEELGPKKVAVITGSDGRIISLLTGATDPSRYAERSQYRAFGFEDTTCAQLIAQAFSVIIVGSFEFDESRGEDLRGEMRICLIGDKFVVQEQRDFFDKYVRRSN